MKSDQSANSQFLQVHPVLMSSDVRHACNFFVALGFETVYFDDPVNPKYACLERDNVEIQIQWNAISGAASTQDRPVYRFLVRDVDALYLELSARSQSLLALPDATPWHAPANTPWGTREFHVQDPSGNGLQFYQLQHPTTYSPK